MRGQRHILFAWRYLLFFLVICFAVTASFLLFFHTMNLDIDAVRRQAPLVFWNIIFLSAICCGVDWLLYRITEARPVGLIRLAARQIASGDLSARIDMEDFSPFSGDYRDIALDINAMAAELSETETLRTDFVSNVSHEMKTPLAVIRNYAALLKGPQISDGERLRCAEGIDLSVQRMTALITNTLKLNKLEHQQLQAQPRLYDLSEQVVQCILGFDEALEARDLDLQTDIAEGVQIVADPELLTLVWNNLLSNAVKFTPEGGAIAVTVSTEGDDAVVTVKDTGCGMDAATGKHIFDKFYQGDTSHATEGNGLGLSLVKRVIDLTGGEIAVQSQVGRGSTFTVRLGRIGHE